jgi:formamidopyrimidine-DNA glycosylase
MPELPEVETLCRQLQIKIAGKRILSTEVYDDKLKNLKNLQGKRIANVQRKGKTIVINLNDENSVYIHLRMTGRLFWQTEKERPKHSRWKMNFKDGAIYLIDPRRFATIKIQKRLAESVNNDLITNFEEESFLGKNSRRKTKIKNLLMDQQAISGIGNIYACEILHKCSIHPERKAESLNTKDWQMIFRNARTILTKAIKNRGTSISDWRDLYGHQGENQHELKAYGREGSGCRKCHGIIKRIKQGGRSTFYCPQCQK